ncbi:Sec23-binding domain of Sec16-domain-containing protein [Aspergillus californicus]
MEHSEATAVWNPALRSDDHETLVATPTTEPGPAPLSPTLPTQDAALSVTANPETQHDTTAPIVHAEPSPSDEQILQSETRDEFHEEAAEVLSTVLGDDQENPFEIEPPVVEDLNPTPGTPEAEAQPQQTETQRVAFDPAVEALSDHNDAAWFDQQDSVGQHAPVNGEIGSTNHDFWGSPKSVDNGEDDFFHQLKTQTKPIYFPEADLRYEEGLPLLDDSAPPETPIEVPTQRFSQIDAVFNNDEDEDDGFFNSGQKPTPEIEEQGPFHIQRKSTSQVIDALDAPRDSPTSPLSPTAEEFDHVLAAAASGSLDKVDEAPEEDLAAKWQAELSDDELDAPPVEEDLAARWQAELSDDDDDLLLEDDTIDEPTAQLVNGDSADYISQSLGSPFGTPQSSSRPKPPQNSYTPHQPSTSDLVGVPIPGAIPSTTSAPFAGNYFQPRPEPTVPLTKAESFTDRPKEGYKSPYDLPEDLAPRRKPAPKPVVAPATMPISAPPRSSSITALPQQPALPNPSMGGIPPPQAATPAAAPTPKNFYEELPLPPVRPRSRPASSGRYTPNPSTTGPPVAQPPPMAQSAVIPQLHPSGDMSNHMHQPERLGPYTNAVGSSSAPVVPSLASRYSPKPPTLQPSTKPPASPRYSPAPPPTAAPPPPQRYVSQPSGIPGQAVSLPFQPRTSSPLAHHEKISYHPEMLRKSSLPQPAAIEPSVNVQQLHFDSEPPLSPRSAQNPILTGAVDVNTSGDAPTGYQQSSPPRNPYAPSSYIEEFSRRLTHTNSPSAYIPPAEPFAPPRRSQTQSPPQQQLAPRLSVPSLDPFKRPASVHTPSSPMKPINAYAPLQSSNRTRAISQSLDFIPPVDGQELDPLARWKGAPILKFGFGGTVLSCFPKHVPRYSAGQAAPKIKATPGEVKVAQLSDWVSFPESIVHHPGPLRSKSKKKDLTAWLSSKIAAFENEGISENLQVSPDSYKRHEEKVLLWKVVRVLVEHDGGTQNSPELQKSLRSVLFPHLQEAEADPTFDNSFQSFQSFPNSQPMNAASRPDTADPKSLGSIHNNLLLGEREKALWSAADNRLWGHAMIIASTLDKSVWKQVVQEFVRREVRSSTGNPESLSALYEIFAGNFDESVDELVPPSARAGLQMISKVDGQGTSKDALAGLESWKETLGLVLSNRSPDDNQALLALGRLLLSYGRIEAAHICLIFSRASVFAGPDDPQANIVLLGADHVRSSAALLDDDAILLTEAYEYATSVLAASQTSVLPHLMAFKLIHAWSLTDRGQKTEAQQYCDAIASAIKALTKPSPYHHQYLFYGVDELSARLKQTTEGASWISKPSMERVSSSMWSRFSNFVAGDESDAASTGSGKAGEAEFGPFAKVAGTPTISRSPSVSDLYGQYPMPAAQPIPTTGPSRYQPSNQYAPSSSPDQGRGRSSLDSQRSASFGIPHGQRRESQEFAPSSESLMYAGGPFYGSPSAGYQSTPPQTSYMPLAPVDEDMAQQNYPTPTAAPQGFFAHDSPYQPSVHNSFDQSFGNATPAGQLDESSGYMPPGASTGYEPLSTVTNGLEATGDVENEEPRRKSVMNDEDDELAARAETLKKEERARKDREADEAFRKAAEADAQKAAPAKGSWWFSGWMKGGNKEEANSNAAAGKPIRAKLGEESSFYYDKDLNKWVNKKDPSSATPARATPPPPRGTGPPSRSTSGSSMPPPPPPAGPGSRPQSSAGAPLPPLSGSPVTSSLGLPPTPMLGAARSVSTGAVSAGGGPSSRPGSSAGHPPRPATSLSTASSIDDLLGAPTVRKGNTGRGRKKGRYVDVMAQ